MKFVKQVINKAKKQGVTDINPFQHYTISQMKSDVEFLTKDEIQKLESFLLTGNLPENQKEVLRYFLFSCYTALRYSDIKTIKYKEIVKETFKDKEYYFLKKITQKSDTLIKNPLPQKAIKFLKNGMPEQFIFRVLTNQATNRNLKIIAKMAGINKVLTSKIGRHTFGTEMANEGMRLEVISNLMGHAKLETTRIYSKITIKQKFRNWKNWKISLILKN